MRGFVAISRELWDDVDFRDAEMSQREAWVWMIAHATWKGREIRVGANVVKLERGQLAYSTRYLAGVFQWSEARVRRYFDMLKNRRMARTETDAGVTVITICKYDDYQSAPDKSDAPATQQPTQERRTSDANKNQDNQDNQDIPTYGAKEAEADYNQLAEQVGLRKSIKLSDKRRKAISARLNDHGPDGWKTALAAVKSQDWMLGKGDRAWKADIDYISRPDPFIRLLEIAESEGLKSSGPVMPESDDQWRRCVRQFVNHAVWHAPGPKPGETGCNAPDAILEEFGIDTLGGQLRLVAGT